MGCFLHIDVLSRFHSYQYSPCYEVRNPHSLNRVYLSSVTMILFANIAYNEMRGFVMGACETIAGITRMLVRDCIIMYFLLCRVL